MKQLFNNNNKKKKAFTLIELLVVIAIIGILSGAVIVAMSGTQESAIDSRIKASMAQLRSSIEIYGLVNGVNYTGLESDSEISLLIDDITSQVGTPTVNISGSGDRYCLSTNLKSSNEKWCIDSSGYGGLGDCINYSCDRSLGYSSGGIPISTGLVGYWTMDEDSLLSPNTIRDYSSYGNTGTIYGATFTTDRHGQPNEAMSFDGVNDYINCGNGSSLSIVNEITISVWVKPNILGNRAILSKWGTGSEFLFSFYGNKLTLESPNDVFYYSNSAPIVNEWNFVNITLDGTNIKHYINGRFDRVQAQQHTLQFAQTSNLSIGSLIGNSWWFNGLIDDVRIYNRALSAEEITFLYNSSR